MISMRSSTTLAQQQISALFVAANPLLASQATNLIAMAARLMIKTWNRLLAEAKRRARLPSSNQL
jgi:hypothetical protein